MMNDDNFDLVESFDVDNGELDGLTQQLCFVLGIEWEMVRQEIKSGQSFERPIHSENLERIKSMCKRYGVSFEIAHHDDWPSLIVS